MSSTSLDIPDARSRTNQSGISRELAVAWNKAYKAFERKSGKLNGTASRY